MLEVPFHHQNTRYSCGPASLKMVLEFFGVHVDERKIAKIAHTNKDGTKHKYLISTARIEGFYCYIHDNSTLHEIFHFISIGLPVIVHIVEPTSGEGHYSVVVGFSRKGVILNDPWNGKRFVMGYDKFIENWHSGKGGHLFRKWIMVISNRKFSVGKEYLPK